MYFDPIYTDPELDEFQDLTYDKSLNFKTRAL